MTPGMPPRRKVREFQHRRVALHDPAEGYDHRVALLRITGTEELPAMVVLVVSNVQDRFAAEDD